MDGIYAIASSSTSSLYGNVGCAIRELILSKFPLNYFKYTNVSTEVAFKNMRRQFGSNTNTEIIKRDKPYLVIQPAYQAPDADDFLQSVPLTKNDMDIQSNVDRRYLFDIISDKEHDYNLKFKLNRDRIEYQVTLTVATLHQQLDIYKAMMNQITWERSFYLKTALEAVIPKSLIRYMSKLCNMDIYNSPEFIPMFLKHLNSVSSYPITYKVRNASATDEFFMYYTHNLVCTFTDLDIGGGDRRGMVDDKYDISFKVIADFNLPGMYMLDGCKERVHEMKVSLGTQYNNYFDNEDEYIPLYSMTDFYNKFPPIKDGLTLYGNFIFTMETNDTYEELHFGDILDRDHMRAIRFHTNYGMLPETICNVIIAQDRFILPPTMYTLDWNDFSVRIKNPNNKSTYRFILYLNMESINAALANARIDGPFDKQALKNNEIDYSNVKYREALISSDINPNNNAHFQAKIDGEDKDINELYNAEKVEIENTKLPNQKYTEAYPSNRMTEKQSHVMDSVYNTLERIEDNGIDSIPMGITTSEQMHLLDHEVHNIANLDLNINRESESDIASQYIGNITDIINPNADLEEDIIEPETSVNNNVEDKFKYHSEINTNESKKKPNAQSMVKPKKKYSSSATAKTKPIASNYYNGIDPSSNKVLSEWEEHIDEQMKYDDESHISTDK